MGREASRALGRKRSANHPTTTTTTPPGQGGGRRPRRALVRPSSVRVVERGLHDVHEGPPDGARRASSLGEE